MTKVSWANMNQRPRVLGGDVIRKDVPDGPGVYAWYRDGQPVYVGKATGKEGLRQRIWKNHLRQGRGAISGSAFRRNVAEHLGLGRAAAIKADPSILSDEAVDAINAWVRTCELVYVVTDTSDEALELERTLKVEHKPPLTKR